MEPSLRDNPLSALPAELTIRDHFAIIALSQLIAYRLDETAERKALEAYQIADSMIRQRQRSASGHYGAFVLSVDLVLAEKVHHSTAFVFMFRSSGVK
jgi:hypothetical protein